MSYMDYTNQWLRNLTRQRRLEREIKAVRPETLRFSVTVFDENGVEFVRTLDNAPEFCSGGRRTGAYKRWKREQWEAGVRRCHYCNCEMTRNMGHMNSLTIDHKTPLSLDGPDNESNWCMCCWDCNALKGSLTEPEFRAVMASVMTLEKWALSREGDVTQPGEAQQPDAQNQDGDHGDDRSDGLRHGDVGDHQPPHEPQDRQHDDELNEIHARLTA